MDFMIYLQHFLRSTTVPVKRSESAVIKAHAINAG